MSISSKQFADYVGQIESTSHHIHIPPMSTPLSHILRHRQNFRQSRIQKPNTSPYPSPQDLKCIRQYTSLLTIIFSTIAFTGILGRCISATSIASPLYYTSCWGTRTMQREESSSGVDLIPVVEQMRHVFWLLIWSSYRTGRLI